ncbi:MAG: hypothetical protein GC150_05570 [Rhizobiales bacterium]|nr:hypothetical protein [Hyphomicrobiales bacterium]
MSAGRTCEISIAMHYSHPLGALGPYFEGLERGIAMASRCAACGRVWFAPRLVCTCGSEAGVWITLSGLGRITALTSASPTLPISGRTGNWQIGLIAMDGAHNVVLGRIEAEMEPLVVGDAVRLLRDDGPLAHPVQAAIFRTVR